MISFRVGAGRFQFRVGAVAFEQGHLLLHKAEGDAFWALPGGRVEAGEEAAEAVVREFQEELGLAVKCNELLGVGENFFDHAGEPHHEIGLYFLVSLPLGADILDLQKSHFGVEGSRRLQFRWFPLPELQHLDFRPAALCKTLQAGMVPAHFVQRG